MKTSSVLLLVLGVYCRKRLDRFSNFQSVARSWQFDIDALKKSSNWIVSIGWLKGTLLSQKQPSFSACLFFSLTFFCCLYTSCKPNSETVPDLRTCKIVKETYKTANIPKSSQQLVEAINIDGKLFEVSLNTTRIYSYNDAGQLIKEEFSQWDKGYGSAVYLYKNNRIVITKTFHDGNSNKVSTTTDTLDLNAQGLAKKQSGNPVTYDENGFKKYLGTPPFEFYAIKKGNTEQIIYPNWTGEGGTFTIQHAYDTTKLSIPSNKPFLGIFSKNLLTESTNIMQGSSHYVDGPNYHISYKYSFDKYNRISRRVALGKRLHPLWDLELDRGGIGVTNFEYQCE